MNNLAVYDAFLSRHPCSVQLVLYYFISYSSVIVWCTDNRYAHVNKPVKNLLCVLAVASLDGIFKV